MHAEAVITNRMSRFVAVSLILSIKGFGKGVDDLNDCKLILWKFHLSFFEVGK